MCLVGWFVGWLVGWLVGMENSGINVNLSMFENFLGCFSLSLKLFRRL